LLLLVKIMLIYDTQKESQIEQYKHVGTIHDLPPIYDYWYGQHIAPKIEQIFGIGHTSLSELYASELMPVMQHQDKESYVFASIGAGDASLEADIYRELKKLTNAEIIFECFEISTILIERGKIALENQGIQEQVRLIETDLNFWKSPKIYDGIIAHHSLHHIVELEKVFQEIAQSLSPTSVFVSGDVIGRNGHMRWPEALTLIQSIWQNMTEKYKYNRVTGCTEKQYQNLDCSDEGFEGIRAQDILKLLKKQFNFKKFLGYGNLIDLFIERIFGFNFDPNDPSDRAFIDKINVLNELLIDVGYLKPTYMFATMTIENCSEPLFYKHWTPEFCIREPETNPLDAANPQQKISLTGPIYQVSEGLRYYPDRWISSDFYVELNPCQPIKGISIEGFVPPDHPIPNTIAVNLNGEKYDYTIQSQGIFSVQLLFKSWQSEKFFISIKAEKCVNGYLEGINQDKRTLVFILQEIKAVT
jgi:SAM-dependent methyltransferase